MKNTTYYIILTMLIITFLFFAVMVINYTSSHDYYYQQYLKKTDNKLFFGDGPRGRIYDINGNLLVDNEEVYNIGYNQLKGLKKIDVAKKLAVYTNFENISFQILKDYFLVSYQNEVNDLITDQEYKLLERRKLSTDEITSRKESRITDAMLNKLNDLEKQAAYIYYLMNKGYSREYKYIIKDVDKSLYDEILGEDIKGVVGLITYKRKFMYDTTFNQLIGTIGYIKPDKEKYYQDLGYSLDSVVGKSYIEEQYENYLHGTRGLYQINPDYSLTLINPPVKGQDIYLNIDINLQMETEEILKKSIIKLRKLKNTEFYNRSYVVISEPLTGKIKAITGIQLISNMSDTPIYNNVTSDIINKSFVMGSVIKGASSTYAYMNDLIVRDKYITDSCVKLLNIPAKCSFKRLGRINDITALKWSSNYYQFLLAINSTGNKYKRNMKLTVTEDNFNDYRNIFKQFGLGSKTEIDLPSEFLGITGKTVAPDLLLNLTIGQYDTYTPLQLTQYINTIASGGKRYQLQLIDKVINNEEVVFTNQANVLNTININSSDMERIKEGFRQVLDGGTGLGYINKLYLPAGKTGTSESFTDTDGDLINDTKTITETSAMYAPYNNPKYSIVIISPDSSHVNGKTEYIAPINSRISKEVTKNLFENY